jgi:hypothetical protein
VRETGIEPTLGNFILIGHATSRPSRRTASARYRAWRP